MVFDKQRKILEQIAEELRSDYDGRLTVKHVPAEVYGGIVLFQELIPNKGIFRTLRTKRRPILNFVQYPYSSRLGMHAFDKKSFECAKSRYEDFLATVPDAQKDDFRIIHSSLDERTRSALREILSELSNQGRSITLRDHVNYERDEHGLTVAPFSSVYEIVENPGKIKHLVSVVHYNPEDRKQVPILMYETNDPNMGRLLEGTLRSVALDHTENGVYPRVGDEFIDIKKGHTEEAVLFFGIETGANFVETKSQ